MAVVRMGWFGEDVADFVSDVGDSLDDAWGGAWGFIDDVTNVIPGCEWLKDQVGGVINDMAQTWWGKILITALADSFFGPAAQILGPQLASIVWAIPGVAAGEPFAQSWALSFIDRCKQVGEYFGGQAAQDAMEQVQPAIDEVLAQVKARLPEFDASKTLEQVGIKPEDFLKNLGITPESIAAKLGIREDMAADAINKIAGKALYDLSSFDLRTGKSLRSRAFGDLKMIQTAVQLRALPWKKPAPPRPVTAADLARIKGGVKDIQTTVSSAALSAPKLTTGMMLAIGVPLVSSTPVPARAVPVAAAGPAPSSSARTIEGLAVVAALGAAAAAGVWFFVGKR
jgi:hypothetical protein